MGDNNYIPLDLLTRRIVAGSSPMGVYNAFSLADVIRKGWRAFDVQANLTSAREWNDDSNSLCKFTRGENGYQYRGKYVNGKRANDSTPGVVYVEYDSRMVDLNILVQPRTVWVNTDSGFKEQTTNIEELFKSGKDFIINVEDTSLDGGGVLVARFCCDGEIIFYDRFESFDKAVSCWVQRKPVQVSQNWGADKTSLLDSEILNNDSVEESAEAGAKNSDTNQSNTGTSTGEKNPQET